MQVFIFYCLISSYVVIMTKRKTVSVTVRLPKELTEWIDNQIDGVDFRNRTHVIEKALMEFRNKKK